MNCPNCGSPNMNGASNCANCGAPLTQQTYGYAPQPEQPAYGYPAQPAQPAYGYAPATPAVPGKGMAIASLVCGILSFFVAAAILGTLAIIFGGVAKSKGNTTAMPTAGIVCGVIGIALWIITLVFLPSLMLSMF